MLPDSEPDLRLMARALALAEESVGMASPNPQVGCVLVRDGETLGEGAHRYELYDHAEIAALKAAASAGRDVVGATAYVTLEPCSHHGRTGPCADALIAAGLARVVVATDDPNPEVSGRGIARLRAAGVKVEIGVLEAEARALNDAFAFSIVHGRPFVTLKAALSVDGMLAPPPGQRKPGEPFWLTGADARKEVQQIRHGSDAVLTGIGTVLADDALLTDRTGLARRRPLLRVVLDSQLRIPMESRLVRTIAGDLRIFCGEEAAQRDPAKLQTLEGKGAICTALPMRAGRIPLERVLAHLHSAQIRSVLLEAGAELNGVFLREDLVDRVLLFYSETELGPEAVPFASSGERSFSLEQRLRGLAKRQIGKDVLVSGVLHDPWRSRPFIPVP